MSSTPRFLYLNVRGKRVGCVAVSVDREHAVVHYRTSVKHPKDEFSKEKARVIAAGRLASEPETVRVHADANSYEISSAVMLHLSRKSDAPARARKAAEEWLAANPEHT